MGEAGVKVRLAGAGGDDDAVWTHTQPEGNILLVLEGEGGREKGREGWSERDGVRGME